MVKIKRAFVGAVLITATLLTGCQKSQTRKENTFAFRKMVQDETTMEQAEALGVVSDCNKASPWGRACRLSDSTLAGVAVVPGVVDFGEDGKFHSLSIEIDPNDYATIRDALTSAYGQPCRKESRHRKLSEEEAVESEDTAWCFQGGILDLRQMTPGDSSRGVLDYFPHKPVPVHATPATYSSETL
ncbi:hypothetical protein [Novosphingobium sp.]|uniref:hypothetical protein n=1 Tax=Novosphingobium sp. TaxID=1874826 RepID=UPI00261CFE98|nr:hypothetical protein [Novosphingobium sp.]